MTKFSEDFYSNVSGSKLAEIKHVIEEIENNETDEMKAWHGGQDVTWQMGLLNPYDKSFFLKRSQRAVLVNDKYVVYLPNKESFFDMPGHLAPFMAFPNNMFELSNTTEPMGDRAQLSYEGTRAVLQIVEGDNGDIPVADIQKLIDYLKPFREQEVEHRQEVLAQQESAKRLEEETAAQRVADRRSRLNAAPVQPEEEPDMGEESRTRVGRNAGVQQHRHERVEQVEETVQAPVAPVEPEPAPRKARTTSGNAKFSFDTAKYIISANTIPDGFVFLKPVYYGHSSLSAFLGNALSGHVKAYNKVLASIQAEIDKGEYDAVFNMRVITIDTSDDSGEFDCIIYGDACIVAE